MTPTRCTRCGHALVGRRLHVMHARVRLDGDVLRDEGDRAPDEVWCERCVDDEERGRLR